MSGTTQQTTGPVILEGPAQHLDTGRRQGRCNRVAGVSTVAVTIEGEFKNLATIDRFASL
jgi:hypothetical protein